jgi:hypothetical protein
MSRDRNDRTAVMMISAVIIVNAMLFLMSRDRTYVHIDAIAHVNKARALFDNSAPGLYQLGTVWLPLPHLLMAPLAWFDVLWTSGAAGSILSAICFIGTGWFLFASTRLWTGLRSAAWLAFLLFVLNPRLIYLFTTPMTEPMMILCSAGLMYYLVRWSLSGEWAPFGMAASFAFAGTLTRYEGWALAAAATAMVALLSRKQKAASTILFAGAACLGPVLWMLFNMFYFEDPLIFTWGRGSARDYAFEHFLNTGQTYATAGSLAESLRTYVVDVAYCVNPAVFWMALAGIALVWTRWRRQQWRTSLVILMPAFVFFGYYVFNLYSNMVPILLPGLINNDPQSMFNVRYGSVMAVTLPILAAATLDMILRQIDRHRAWSLLMITPLFLPNPIPEASQESLDAQLTDNLFYREGIRNQSFWMPPFVEVAKGLEQDIEQRGELNSYILANTRVVHPVVWATGIPMRSFISEMHKQRWEANLNEIDSGIRWVITEEGDQLWEAQGAFLLDQFTEVARSKTASTGTVYLFRRP